MKRVSADDIVDSSHPALAFHREVLINLKWSAIRSDFFDALHRNNSLCFLEPKKLWRHSQEALGKWILSQVARETHSSACHSFFPSTAGSSATTYDEQLVRDISLKCELSGSSDVVSAIKQLLADFNLSRRCKDAATEVMQGLETASFSSCYTPLIRFIGAAEKEGRTALQRRMEGPIVEFSVQWPRNTPHRTRRSCPPVSIPLAAYRKLDVCYRHFAENAESKRYPRLDYNTRFSLRAAALAFRYEGCLATGALQLSADTKLKQYLHAAGYHVMDLCASPINAYMGSPSVGLQKHIDYCNNENNNNDGSGSSEGFFFECETIPNNFCSAFPDTDCYFGSLGSALKFDVEAAYNSCEINPEKRPLLLTLDVPYDEDLCEQLFLKLVVDMRRAEKNLSEEGEEASSPPFVADYILVLPLWWNVPLQREKRFFTASDVTLASLHSETKAFLDSIIKERTATLQKGYIVNYEWPLRLAEAAGERWVCFDGVFGGDSYQYFCTATNKVLRGVTATEVIGLAQPRKQAEKDGLLLENLLAGFYGKD